MKSRLWRALTMVLVLALLLPLTAGGSYRQAVWVPGWTP